MKYRLVGSSDGFSEDTSPAGANYILLRGAVIISLIGAGFAALEAALPALYLPNSKKTLTYYVTIEDAVVTIVRQFITEDSERDQTTKVLPLHTSNQVEEALLDDWEMAQQHGWTPFAGMNGVERLYTEDDIRFPAVISPIMRGSRYMYNENTKRLSSPYGKGVPGDGRLLSFCRELAMPLDGMLYHPAWYDARMQEDQVDHLLIYHVFDSPDNREPNYVKRMARFMAALRELGGGNDQIKMVPFALVTDVEDMKSDIRTLRNAGQVTGVVVRDIISPYKSYSTSDKMFEIHFEEKQNV